MKIFKKKEEVEVTAVIQKMECKKSKEDEDVLICDIVAKSGDKEIRDKIGIKMPKLKFIEIKEEKKKPQYYFKEVEV